MSSASDNGGEDLGLQLHRVKEYTIDENRVRGVVDDYEVTDKSIKLDIEKLTDGKKVRTRMRRPEPWTDEFTFVRLLRSHGYNAASPDLLVGDEVVLRKDGATWDIEIQETALSEFKREWKEYVPAAAGITIGAGILRLLAMIDMGVAVMAFFVMVFLGLVMAGVFDE